MMAYIAAQGLSVWLLEKKQQIVLHMQEINSIIFHVFKSRLKISERIGCAAGADAVLREFKRALKQEEII